MSSVIGGAMLPHAPQFFTMPETEDRNTVERVKTAAAEIGTRLRALRPDLWIIFANDHVEQFFLTAAPPFTIHVGNEAKGGMSQSRELTAMPRPTLPGTARRSQGSPPATSNR
jgi:2,3-dihydroxyphenylpropionate 1,2-dioxygenase